MNHIGLKVLLKMQHVLKNSGSEKLLGVNIDSKVNFDCHVNHLSNKANKKLRDLLQLHSI